MSVGEALSEQLRPYGWNILTTTAKRGRFARVVDMLSTVYKSRDSYNVAVVDVYSGHAFAWAEAVSVSLRWLSKPYVLVLRGGNLPAYAVRWPNRVRRLLSRASKVVAPSEYLREHFRTLRADITLVPNPIDVRTFTFRHRSVISPNLVWLRAFHRLYNPGLAIDVLAGLHSKYPDARLTMIGPDTGDGSYGECRQRAIQLGLGNHISWPGGIPHNEVDKWLREGDVFLNTPSIDNVPVSVLEAMATGLCVVSTDVGGLPQLLSNGRDALLTLSDDADAMVAAIERLIREPGLASQLSENARLKAEQFDWGSILAQWEDLLIGLGDET